VPTPLEIYEKLKPKLGEEEARVLVEYIQEAVKEPRADLATRSDLAVLKADLEGRMDVLKADLGRQIESVKADLIKWTFAFWIGNIAVISGIVFAIVRLSTGR